MEITGLSKKYNVRRLDKNDVDILYEMMSKNHIFYEYHPPFITKESILDDMVVLPPGKKSADKFYIGFFKNASLVAVMDLILDYPTKDIAFIGLFMMNTQYQNQGVGTEIICDVKQYLKSSGCKEI